MRSGWLARGCVAWLALTLALAAASVGVAAADGKPAVAVLYFDYDGSSEEMGHLRKGLTQMLVSDLADVDAIDIVERTRLEEVVSELELGRTRKINKKSAAKIGKLLGARYLVMGGYFDFRGSLRVDTRVVEVETGKVLTSIGDNRKIDDFLALEQKLASELGQFFGALNTGARPDGARGSKRARATAPKAKPKSKVRSKAKTKRSRRLAPPTKLTATTAARYGRALDHLDRGDKDGARKQLKKVVEAQPDFELAAVDLASLAQ